MNAPHLPLELLADYWARATEEEASVALEDHLFACDACARRLQMIAALASGVAGLVKRAGVFVAGTAELVAKLERDGRHLRHYRMRPGERVLCTVRPEDDYVVTWHGADFHPGTRIDVERIRGEEVLRLEDVPVDLAAGAVIAVYPGDYLRPLGHELVKVRLLERSEAGERTLAEYLMDHAPGRPV